MSKHPSDHTKRSLLRQGLAGILSLALLLGLLPSAIITPAQAHWADSYVETLVDWGVMRGDINGNMAPERSITRAEFVAMMNRAYGYSKLGGHPFTDVSSRSWYNQDIDIAYNMGYFKGTGPTTASPNSTLTREQAAVLLARNMMLQETVGETLGFSDTRSLSDWSRGLVGAAAANGILGGYSDGSFKPQRNITRGEVAAMLVRSIGTPIQTAGDHKLGNVYGNVTVNTAGVALRDGVITGNLYLTGGIDLGDVLMENVTVLGEIIVSGGGESQSSQSSITLRNVTANSMSVDSISDQFVTIRAEGNTDIKTTTVRTNAYVDDSSLPGYGLWKIIQDGGSLLQLAGNTKEVINKTPDSDLQVVQGTAGKITIDEYATGSSVLVDGDARVDELNLDVATAVTGEGDIKDLNVGAAGCTVEQLPDNITIRPGITTDINGSEMNSSQAAQASAEPKLLAGYPKAKNIAPTSATLVFSVNKPGTVYWAISAISDGSVSEEDLIENPTYGGKIVKAGNINATAANTEYTANVTGLAQDGSYYISAILVDGRGERSPVKVTAFSTPDGTVPAFVGNPTASLRTVEEAQVTGMPNKSCLLYYALLPDGATAPTPAEFKANAVRGNLGYGTRDVVKNVNVVVPVNRSNLKEKTYYVAYLWLTDYDGAQSSQVYSVRIYIPDQTPPVVNDMRQRGGTATTIEASFTMNETGRLYWAVVTDEDHEKKLYLDYDHLLPETNPTILGIDDEDIKLGEKIRLISGQGAIVSGSVPVTAANTLTRLVAQGLDPEVYNTSSFVLYYVGEDSEENLSDDIGFLEVNVTDQINPEFVEYRFDSYGSNDREHPLANTAVTLVFSESVQSGASRDKANRFLSMYQEVEQARDEAAANPTDDAKAALDAARDALGKALYESIKLYAGGSANPVPSDMGDRDPGSDNTILNYRYAQITKENGRMLITFPRETGVNLESGVYYHFQFTNIYDCAVPPNDLIYNDTVNKCYTAPEFRTASAQVDVREITPRPLWMAMAKSGSQTLFSASPNATKPASGYDITITEPGDNTRISHYVDITGSTITQDSAQKNDPSRIDVAFTVDPTTSNVGPDVCYDMLIWADTNIEFTLYSRPLTRSTTDTEGTVTVSATPWSASNAASWSDSTPVDAAAWVKEGSGVIINASKTETSSVYGFTSLFGNIKRTQPDLQMDMAAREYVIHVDKVSDGRYGKQDQANEWNETIQFRVTLVSGAQNKLNELGYNPPTGTTHEQYYNTLMQQESGNLAPISNPEHLQMRKRFTDSMPPEIQSVNIVNSDTQPRINVSVDRPGTIYCIAVPLENVTYKKTAGGAASTPDPGASIREFLAAGNTVSSFNVLEDVILADGTTRGDITNLNPLPYPQVGHADLVKLAAPSAVKLTGNTFGEGTVKGVGTTGSATSAAVVRFEKALQPNTIYFLCIAAQGSTSQSLATSTSGYWFVTDPADKPILRLSEAGSVNVTAQVDRTALVQARLLLQNNLGNAATSVFAEQLSKPGNFDTSRTLPTEYQGYTVLQALQATYTAGKGYSVFDEFASADLKERVQRIVEYGSGNIPGNTSYGNWGPYEIVKPANTWGSDTTKFDESRLDENAYYVCVAVAYTSETGPRSFRALDGLQVVNDDPPLVVSVSVGNLQYQNGLMSGFVTINFDKTLWLPASSGTSILPMAQTPKDDSASISGFRPLGAVMKYPTGSIINIMESVTGTSGKYSETSQMTFLISGMGSSFSIDLPAVLCSKWNNSIGTIGGGSITCTYNTTTNAWTKTVTRTIQAPNYTP